MAAILAASGGGGGNGGIPPCAVVAPSSSSPPPPNGMGGGTGSGGGGGTLSNGSSSMLCGFWGASGRLPPAASCSLRSGSGPSSLDAIISACDRFFGCRGGAVASSSSLSLCSSSVAAAAPPSAALVPAVALPTAHSWRLRFLLSFALLAAAARADLSAAAASCCSRNSPSPNTASVSFDASASVISRHLIGSFLDGFLLLPPMGLPRSSSHVSLTACGVFSTRGGGVASSGVLGGWCHPLFDYCEVVGSGGSVFSFVFTDFLFFVSFFLF